MTYVYILSTYNEHGSENVIATLKREKLPDFLIEEWPWCKEKYEFPAGVVASDLDRLNILLRKEDEKLAGRFPHSLGMGWGGVQLHVVELSD